MNQNLVGSRSTLYLGYFNDSLPNVPYKMVTELTDELFQQVFVLNITAVSFGEYLYPATIKNTTSFTPTVIAVIANLFPYVLLQSTDDLSVVTNGWSDTISRILPGTLLRNLEPTVWQVYYPQADCADIAINSGNLTVKFQTLNNYEYKMNQALFKQDGEDCALMVLFEFGATTNQVILGIPAMHNMNITIDYDSGLIGLSNGVNLTPIPIDYVSRAIILIIMFTLITLGGCGINYTIERAKKLAQSRRASVTSATGFAKQLHAQSLIQGIENTPVEELK